MCGWSSAYPYSLLGPIGNGGDAWQVPNIAYGLPGDIGAPKNLGEEYRINVPVLVYAYDATFLDYFGLTGAANVDGAFSMLNGLTNVSSYSANLSEFPLNSQQINYTAQALGLTDLKSTMLGLMVEHLGLASPDRYTWTLHNRYQPPGTTCPDSTQYLVVMRNFDYLTTPANQIQYSPYVNGTLYAYQIVEDCSTTPQPEAATFPYLADPLAQTYTPVASFAGGGVYINGRLRSVSGLNFGGFYTGLSRDDVAGLRYMLSAANRNTEVVPASSQLFTVTTNFSQQVSFPPDGYSTTNGAGFYYFQGNTNNSGGFGYGDLAAFMAFAKTNGPAALQAAYPGVVVAGVHSTNAVVSLPVSYTYSYQTLIGAPYGSPPVLVVTTNYQNFTKTYYQYQFANVFTNHYYINKAAWVSTYVGPMVGAPYGSPSVTNTTTTYTDQIGGDFFVLPLFYTNFCPLDIAQVAYSNVLTTTNVLVGGDTNLVTATNTVSISQTLSVLTYFTKYTYWIYPVSCTQDTTNAALRQGIERVSFVRANYDSLLGQFFEPVTNYYTMTRVTNSQPVTEYYQRVITAPDIVFSAADLAAGPSGIPGNAYRLRSIGFDESQVLGQNAGPGVIYPETHVTLNKVGPVYLNSSPFLMQGPSADFTVQWGSFDGTTNEPVLYPNGTSIANLEAAVLLQVSPASLPVAHVGQPFTQSFTATGGVPPYTLASPNISVNVPGMSFSGSTLTGTPTATGAYPLTIQVTDSVNRVVNVPYTLFVQ